MGKEWRDGAVQLSPTPVGLHAHSHGIADTVQQPSHKTHQANGSP